MTRCSIIVPVLNETGEIEGLLRHLKALPGAASAEVIVVDGGVAGDTLQAIRAPGVIRLRAPVGRARQMNAGAASARGAILLFLHADTRLPENALPMIYEIMGNPAFVGGAFDLGIRSDRRSHRFIAAVASLRSRLTQIPYGDQAIFLNRACFERLGGYPDIPLMEDVALMRRIKRERMRIHILPSRVSTSPRRWEAEGILWTTLRNWTLLALYGAGVSPATLARHYRSGKAVYERSGAD